jgi:voltage-gated potassium channel
MRTQTAAGLGGKPKGAVARLRAALHRQLDPEAWPSEGLSPLNWVILWLILASVVFGLVATEKALAAAVGQRLVLIDHAILVVFAVEYVGRLSTIGLNPRFRGLRGVLRYALRPASIADLVVLLPLFMAAPPTWILIIRLLRILRLFRLAEFPRVHAALDEFGAALAAKRFELMTTLVSGVLLLILSSTALYLCEKDVQPENFGSVPRALWWAVVTFTTVGYGDAVPSTTAGKFFAGFFAIAGLALAAMLTGVVASALSDAARLHRDRGKPGFAAKKSAQNLKKAEE